MNLHHLNNNNAIDKYMWGEIATKTMNFKTPNSGGTY